MSLAANGNYGWKSENSTQDLDPKILDGYSVNSEKNTSSFGTGYVAYGIPVYDIFAISSRSLSENLVVSVNKKCYAQISFMIMLVFISPNTAFSSRHVPLQSQITSYCCYMQSYGRVWLF